MATIVAGAANAETCEGGCATKVFTRDRTMLEAKTGAHHTAERCRALRAQVTAKAAEKAEAKNVVRHFQHYTSEQRATHAASHRLTQGQRQSVGEHFYTHPAVPNRAFDTRGAAARAGLAAKSVKTVAA